MALIPGMAAGWFATHTFLSPAPPFPLSLRAHTDMALLVGPQPGDACLRCNRLSGLPTFRLPCLFPLDRFLRPIADGKSRGLHWFFMPEGAHHLDLRGPHPSDPSNVTATRAAEQAIIREWIEAAI